MGLEQYIVQYGAPTLAGIKAGSLFSFPVRGDRRAVYRQIYSQNLTILPRGVKIEVLGERRDRLLVYIYRVEDIRALLSGRDTGAFLRRRGYMPEASVGAAIKRLRDRVGRCGGEFPHEIGVFLGYPLADVEAFITDGGKNYAYLGYWKAYHHPERARAVCDQYRACTARLLDRQDRGTSLAELVETGPVAG